MPLIEGRFPEILADAIKKSFKAACECELPAVDLFEHYHNAILEYILCILGSAAHMSDKKPHHGHIPFPQVTYYIALTVTKTLNDLAVGILFHF
jgi:hypothetical protein